MRSFQSAMNYLPDPVKLAGFALFLGLGIGVLVGSVQAERLAAIAYAAAYLVLIFGKFGSPAYKAAWLVITTILIACVRTSAFF